MPIRSRCTSYHDLRPQIDSDSRDIVFSTEAEMDSYNEKTRSRGSSFSVEIRPQTPLRMPQETAELLEAGYFAPPERVNVTPSPDTSAKPFNFGTVIPGVYRSSYPQDHDYGFIQRLGIKSIITLVEDMTPTFQPFLAAQGIKHHIFAMRGTKKESIPLETMHNILSVVLDKRHHPLLIHCNKGKHRTGCVVGIVRKLSGWHANTIQQEYKIYAEPKIRETDLAYISSFNIAHLASLFPQPSFALRRRAPLRHVMTALVMIVLLVEFYKLCLRQLPCANG